MCLPCRDSLIIVDEPQCQQCGVPVKEGRLCPKCVNSSFAINGFRSVYLYQGLAREVVHTLKYNNRESMAQPVSELMSAHLTTHPIHFDVIVPVPFHQKRLRHRGYNQSGLIAKTLSQLTRTPDERVYWFAGKYSFSGIPRGKGTSAEC